MTVWRNKKQFFQYSKKKLFQASEDDFEIVDRNGVQCFKSRSMLKFWKCKYIKGKWTCKKEGFMMVIFDEKGHFLYKESMQETEKHEEKSMYLNLEYF